MPAPRKLTETEIAARLPALAGWSLRDGKLTRTLHFGDFGRAFGFMTEVALAAERADHHPDWRNAYGTVEIELWTHVSGGITERDFALATVIDALAAGREAGP